MEKSVLNAKELAKRWQLSEATIYSLNRAGRIPHLEVAENRFPVKAIELMEEEPGFNPKELRTPRERRLEREIKNQQEVISQKDEEIKALKGIIARIQAYSTGAVYSFNELGG